MLSVKFFVKLYDIIIKKSISRLLKFSPSHLTFCHYLNSYLADKLPAHALVCKIAFANITINHGHVASLDSLPCSYQLHVAKSCLIFT